MEKGEEEEKREGWVWAVSGTEKGGKKRGELELNSKGIQNKVKEPQAYAQFFYQSSLAIAHFSSADSLKETFKMFGSPIKTLMKQIKRQR